MAVIFVDKKTLKVVPTETEDTMAVKVAEGQTIVRVWEENGTICTEKSRGTATPEQKHGAEMLNLAAEAKAESPKLYELLVSQRRLPDDLT